MNEFDSTPLSDIVEEVLKNGNSDPQYLQILQNFLVDSANIRKCQEILQNPENSDVFRFFASEVLFKLTKQFIGTWNMMIAMPLFRWSFDYMKEISRRNKVDSSIFTNLSQAMAIILSKLWETSNCDECLNELDNIIQLFDEDPSQWTVGLFILLSFHEFMTFSNNPPINPDSNSESSSANSKDLQHINIEVFTKKCLPSIFRSAIDIAKRIRNTALPQFRITLEMSLKLIADCLSNSTNLDFLCGSPSSPIFSFNDSLFDNQMVTFFFEIYSLFFMPQALKCVLVIANMIDAFEISNINNVNNKTDRINFRTYCNGGENDKHNYRCDKYSMINDICNGLYNILHEKIGLENNNENVDYISLIASSVASKMNFSTIQRIDKFQSFIGEMLNFTNQIIQSYASIEKVENVINFWTDLEKALRNDGNVEPKRLLFSISPQICYNYISFLLNFSCLDDQPHDFLGLLSGNICKYVFPVQNFVIMNPHDILPQILTGIVTKQKEFFANIDNENLNMTSEKQLALFVHISTAILLIKTSSSNAQDPNIQFHPDFFAFLTTLMQMSAEMITNNGKTCFPTLEMGLVLFISQFKNTLFACSAVQSQLSKNLYQKLRMKRSFSTFPDCQMFFFERVLVTLHSFSNERILLDTAINYLHNDKKITPKNLSSIFETPFEQSFPFALKIENKSLRSRLLSTLISIIYQLNDENCFTLLLNSLESRFKPDISQIEVCFLAIDIYGIFNEAKDNASYIQIFDWFISSGHSDLFTLSVPEYCSNDELINLILKMWKSIVQCTPLKRIVFQSDSPNGIILFKMAEKVISSYLVFIQHVLNDDKNLSGKKYKGLQYTAMILQNLVAGGYVIFGAFKIYNDPVFVDLLRTLSETFHKLSWNEVFQYPNFANSIVLLFRDLVVNQIDTVIQADMSLMTIIFDCIFEFFNGHQKNDEAQKWIFDTISTFLMFMIDKSLDDDEKQFDNLRRQLANINMLIWSSILSNVTPLTLNSSTAETVKLMFLSNISNVDTIKAKFSLNVTDMKKNELDKLLMNLNKQITENQQNSSEIITCLIDIKTFMNQFPSVSYM